MNFRHIAVAGLIFFISAGMVCAEQTPKIIDPAGSTNKIKKHSSKKAADAQTQKDRMKNKYYQLKEGMEFTAADIERMKEIIAKQDEYIASTNNKLMEMENLRQKLVPYLNEVVVRLEAEVKNDLPFSQEERAKALAGFKETVAYPKISMGEKLKKVLEGVRTEMDYGNSVELGMEEIPYKGQKLQVNVLRLGRTALFMRTIDDKEAGVYNGREWVPVADEYNAEIKKAMENQKRSKSAEFVNLPIRRAAQ